MNAVKTLVRTPIACSADIDRIERAGYAAFMPFDSLGPALEDAAQAHGDRPALHFLHSADLEAPGQIYSYRQFLTQVRQTANLFHSLGVSDEHAVGFLLPPVPAAYFTLFGGALAGRVCPVNYLLDTEHIAALLHAAKARVLVVAAPTSELKIDLDLELLTRKCPDLQHVLWAGAGDTQGLEARAAAQRGDALDFQREVGRDTVAAYFHTGGTTGAPKLAQHTHGNELHAAWSAAQFYETSKQDVIVNGFPLFHVAGAFVFGLSTLLSGGCVLLPTALGMRNTAFVRQYWRFAEKLGVTLIAAVPTVLAALANVELEDANISSVRALLTGGSPLPDELAAAFEARHGIAVRNILGMTECAGVVSVEPISQRRAPGSCGLRLPFTEVCALEDAVDGAASLHSGETGILALKGPNVGPGYLNAGSNAGTFLQGGWLATGDIGRVEPDGRIYITGRAKDVIIRSSHNIDPRMIEDALMLDAEVAFAAAVGEPDEYAGEVPVAFVVLKPGAETDPQALLDRARPHIAERPAVPKRITFIQALPTTAVGKIYRPALRLMAMETALSERLVSQGLNELVQVKAVESGKNMELHFWLRNGGDEQLCSQVERMMQPFSIAFRLFDEQGTVLQRRGAAS